MSTHSHHIFLIVPSSISKLPGIFLFLLPSRNSAPLPYRQTTLLGVNFFNFLILFFHFYSMRCACSLLSFVSSRILSSLRSDPAPIFSVFSSSTLFSTVFQRFIQFPFWAARVHELSRTAYSPSWRLRSLPFFVRFLRI